MKSRYTPTKMGSHKMRTITWKLNKNQLQRSTTKRRQSKIDGVPLIMGANWLLLGLVCRDVVKKIIANHWLIIIFSALLMVLIDTLIEPLSNRLDFWTWENNIIPFSNYKDWFLIALLNQYIFSFLKFKKDMFFWSFGYIIILVLFFISFYLK